MTNLITSVLDHVLGPVRYWVVALPDGARRAVAARWQPAHCVRFSASCGGHATQAFAQMVADEMNSMQMLHGWEE